MKKSANIDHLLEKCGDFHSYQHMLLGLFCLVNIISSMHYYSQTIISFVPEHWCYSENISNLTIDEVRNYYSRSSNPSCILLNESTKLFNENTLHETLEDRQLSRTQREAETQQISTNEVKCQKWIYDYDFLFGYHSMTSDLNWVCENSWKSVIGQSTYFIGSVVGTLIFGILSDIIGRLPVLIFAHITAIVGNGLTIFVTNEYTFAMCRFISGMATDTNFVMIYILVMEYISPRMRTIGLNLCIGVFYCIGSMLSPWLAVWLGNWKLYLIAIILPAMVVPLFYFVIPESAQWLISHNKLDRALVCYQKIAKFNRKILNESFMEEFKTVVADINSINTKAADEHPSMIGLFKTPRLRRLTLILCFKSMIITLGYDAISKNVEGLGMSPFILFTLSASAILPACLVLLAVQDKIGRKATSSLSLLVSGFFTAGTGIAIVYQQTHPIMLTVLSIIGRFAVTVAYNSGAQYATELIPTCVRGQGLSLVHLTGYAFTFFSSYILYTAIFFKALPSLILGVLCFCGAVCCLFLPETLKRKTPVTLQDGENFGHGERFFHFTRADNTQQ